MTGERYIVWSLSVSPLRGCTLYLSLMFLFFFSFFLFAQSVFSLLRPLCWTTVCIAGDGCSHATFFVSSCWFLKFTAAHVTIVNNCNNNKKLTDLTSVLVVKALTTDSSSYYLQVLSFNIHLGNHFSTRWSLKKPNSDNAAIKDLIKDNDISF